MPGEEKGKVAAFASNLNMGDAMAVAIVISGGLLTLYALNRGFKGVGDFQLTGSTVRGVEFAANLAVVGGTIRVLQANFPDNRFVLASAFIY